MKFRKMDFLPKPIAVIVYVILSPVLIVLHECQNKYDLFKVTGPLFDAIERLDIKIIEKIYFEKKAVKI